MTEPIYTVTLDEKRKRDAVLAAMKEAASKGKLGIAARIYAIPEKDLAVCVDNNSLGTLTQCQIDTLSLDLVL
jgi:hypothetical protein